MSKGYDGRTAVLEKMPKWNEDCQVRMLLLKQGGENCISEGKTSEKEESRGQIQGRLFQCGEGILSWTHTRNV